jgi:hypothetical protein
MDDQLKTFFGDIRPLNVPPLLVHMSHCKMITSDVSASGVASKSETSGSFGSCKYVQEGPAIFLSKLAYRVFTHDERVRGGNNCIAKRKLNMKKYFEDCARGAKKSAKKANKKRKHEEVAQKDVEWEY